jgi:uracil DNA glycosylase
MSLKIDREEFNELFPETNEISEAELDELVELKNYKVVIVGDDKIIDEHFKD